MSVIRTATKGKKMDITFNKDLFNPIYWHIQKYMNDPNIRYIYLYGGSSAAKTFSVVQKIIHTTIKEQSNTMVLRKYSSDIEDSIYSDFSGIISDWDLQYLFFKIKHKIKFRFGGLIRFRGLDDSEKIKGIALYKRVVMEEMSQFSHEDFKQIRKRLRGAANQQIIGLLNPISEEHWVKKEIIDRQNWTELPRKIDGVKYSELYKDSFVKINEAGNTILIKTTYKDNYWIIGHPEKKNVGFFDKHVINDFEEDRKFDFQYYQVYALGNWGKLDSGAEFYKDFNYSIHVGKTVYDPSEPLHLSFDENVSPYMACTIYQLHENKTVHQIDEICLRHPRNTLQHTITEFIKRYNTHKSGLFLYGDATSRKADVKLEKGYNFFMLILRALGMFNAVIRVPLSNPSVLIRGMWINQIFQGRIKEINVLIGDNCPETISDFKYLKEDSEGKKLKEMVKDGTTKVRYQRYGHTTDTFDYFLTKVFNEDFNEFMGGSSTGKRLALKAKDISSY